MSVALKALLVGAVLAIMLSVLTAATSAIVPWQVALILWGGLLAAGLLWAVLRPVRMDDLGSAPDPAATPADAQARFALLAAADGADIIDICRSRLVIPPDLAPGARARRAVVIFHGLSSCPHAQVALIPLLAAAGCAVLVARMPHHGLADNKAASLRHFLGPVIAAHVDQVVDIAAGLGDELVVAGISGGAVLAGWVAATRAEVDEAVLIAPFYGMATFGDRFNALLMRLMLLLPDFSIWKNPLKGRRSQAPAHNMARQSSRGVGDMMRVGLATRRRASAGRAPAGRVTLVLNEADIAISNQVAESMGRAFAAGGTPVSILWLPRALGLPHELIDPVQLGDRTAIVNPALTALLGWSQIPDGMVVGTPGQRRAAG